MSVNQILRVKHLSLDLFDQSRDHGIFSQEEDELDGAVCLGCRRPKLRHVLVLTSASLHVPGREIRQQLYEPGVLSVEPGHCDRDVDHGIAELVIACVDTVSLVTLLGARECLLGECQRLAGAFQGQTLNTLATAMAAMATHADAFT